MESAQAGATRIETTINGQPFRVNFSTGALTPHFYHAYDRQRQLLYYCLSSTYEIFCSDLSGKVQRVIHREFQPQALTDEQRTEVVDLLFNKEPPLTKKLIGKNLPDHFCAVASIGLLAGGFLVVHRITGLQTIERDLFDGQGRYIYSLVIPGKDAVGMHLFADGRIG